MASVIRYALVVVLLSTAAFRAEAQSADPRSFPQTGYRIDDDGFWSYFQQRGAVNTFGYPASHAFQFLGCTVQFFQRLIMQRCGNGGVVTLNLLDGGLLPYTTIDGSTFPGPSDAMAASAPKPDDPNYGSAVVAFVQSNAPDMFETEPVNFGHTFFNTITPDIAGTDDPSILGLLDLEIWGLPTSQPAYEPTNPNFIYQRFQRGIMHYDKGCTCTRGLLLADYLKALITGQNLPPDLAQQAADSPLLLSAVNGQPPAGTDYRGAFDGVDVIVSTEQPVSNPTPTTASVPGNVVVSATSTPVPATSTEVPPTSTPLPALSRDDPPPGTLSQTLAVNEPIGNANCELPTGLPFAITPLQNDGAQTNPSTGAFEFPALPTVCFSLPDTNAVSVQMKANPAGNSGATVASQTLTPTALGWWWPVPNTPDPPAGPGQYVVTASRGSATTTATVTIEEPTTAHILVLPRRGTPGNTTFQIYAGGLKSAKSPVLFRLYRCTLALPKCQSTSGGASNFTYVTSLGPVQVDSAGHASFALHTSAGDPATQFVVLTDDMLKNFNGAFDMGRAWFCTTTNQSCATE